MTRWGLVTRSQGSRRMITRVQVATVLISDDCSSRGPGKLLCGYTRDRDLSGREALATRFLRVSRQGAYIDIYCIIQ